VLRLEKLATVEREPVPEPEPVRVRRVEWRLGEDGIKELILDYEGGLVVPELQTKYGLSKGSVRKLLSEAGVSMRRRPVPDDVIEQIIDLYESGLSIRQVAAKSGVPKTTVQNLLVKSGVTMRPAVRVSRRSASVHQHEQVQ
jgi:transposase